MLIAYCIGGFFIIGILLVGKEAIMYSRNPVPLIRDYHGNEESKFSEVLKNTEQTTKIFKVKSGF